MSAAAHSERSGPPRQRTIRRPVSVTGAGIHSGARSAVACLPAPPDHGIVFIRTDRPDAAAVRASVDAVSDTHRGVALGRGASSVRTVEHLLAAAHALRITNLVIEVHGEELPILDGSAAPYGRLFLEAGLVDQAAPLVPLVPPAPVWVAAGEASMLALPAPALRVTYVVPLDHPVLGPAQIADLTLDDDAVMPEVTAARTWGFASEVENLRAQGLAGGASLEVALGIGPAGYLNPPRMPDEPARHKIVDLLGDLALLGRPLRAHCIAVGAGHALHIALARRLLHAEGQG